MADRKNLLVIMSDEHQARALSCVGHPLVRTPNLDALAARGVRFENAYTPSPICVPSRAAFASGRYPHQTGHWDNSMPYTGTPAGWGHALQAQGTSVESIGKLHYRNSDDAAGFDVEHIPMHVAGGTGMVWASIRKEGERAIHNVRMLGEHIGPGESPYSKYDAAVVQRTEDWMQRRGAQAADQPWCLYVGLVAPHFPLVVPQEFFDLYPTGQMPETKLRPRDGYVQHPWIAKQDEVLVNETGFRDEEERRTAIASYFGLCSWLDQNVGRILAALDAGGMAEDTTVIYTSDHGENLGARGLWGKSNMYEEATRIPMIVANSPAGGGTVCSTPVSLIDVSETILDHFGAAGQGERPGVSLYRIAAAPPDPERPVFSEYHAIGAVSGAYMLRKGRWKLIHYEGFRPELFDLETDPEELVDRASDVDCAPVLKAMYAALAEICDPTATDERAFADQAALIAHHGGREKALKIGAPAATPPPRL